MDMPSTASAPGPAAQPVLPAVQTIDLNGNPHQLPSGFEPGNVCLIVAFEREQQAECDRVAGLYESIGDPALAHLIELPVINDPGLFMRWFIWQGMRMGVRDQSRRAQVFTIYVDAPAWKHAMNISDNAVYLVRTDHTGVVQEMRPSAEITTAAELRAFLTPGLTAHAAK
jgi:hypothetical protein